jgi:hypothetical protein
MIKQRCMNTGTYTTSTHKNMTTHILYRHPQSLNATTLVQYSTSFYYVFLQHMPAATAAIRH